VAHFSTFEGWTYETFEESASPGTFGPFESLVALWHDKRKGHEFPAWSDFQFQDLVEWYGWLTVEDLIPGDPYDARFRLWGTRVTELFGCDLTGSLMSAAPPGQFDPVEFELIRKMVKEHVIVRCSGPINWIDREHKQVANLALPLSGDGMAVDKILRGVCDLT